MQDLLLYMINALMIKQVYFQKAIYDAVEQKRERNTTQMANT